MLKALNSGISGLNAQQLKVDVIANNIANINTAGFKKSRAEFSQLISQDIEKNGIPVENRDAAIGSGIRVAQAARNNSSGNILQTGKPLDLAIQGGGFFKVVSPNGEERYTRDGTFSMDASGSLVNSQGYLLDGIQAVPGAEKVIVTADGLVKTEDAEDNADAGQIVLYKFTDLNGLKAEGGNLFSYDQSVGESISGAPGDEDFGAIRQGFLEASNVELAEEIANLIEAQRSYGFNTRVIRSVDEMWSLANNLRK